MASISKVICLSFFFPTNPGRPIAFKIAVSSLPCSLHNRDHCPSVGNLPRFFKNSVTFSEQVKSSRNLTISVFVSVDDFARFGLGFFFSDFNSLLNDTLFLSPSFSLIVCCFDFKKRLRLFEVQLSLLLSRSSKSTQAISLSKLRFCLTPINTVVKCRLFEMQYLLVSAFLLLSCEGTRKRESYVHGQ